MRSYGYGFSSRWNYLYLRLVKFSCSTMKLGFKASYGLCAAVNESTNLLLQLRNILFL